MAANNRIFYACQAVIIMTHGKAPSANGVVRGLQSVGMSSNFTLEQVFETGQLSIYENIEDVADIEVTLEKLIDGHFLLYTLASQALCRTSLTGASKKRCDIYLGIFDDGNDNATGSAPKQVCYNSGMYTSSVSYSYSVDGNATESVTLVGNDRFWNADTGPSGPNPANVSWASDLTGVFDGTDSPASGVVRRNNVNISGSTLPAIVKSQIDHLNTSTGQSGGMHIQSISVSADFGQENILELGRFSPYTRYATFPIEVTSEFEVMATSGDLVTVSGDGTNLSNNAITIKDDAGTILTLGTKNKLSSVSYSGGDTGGGNATVTYSFSNFNDLLVNDSKAATSN
tara:strand:- start:6507 stop:7535 length:1029 start_codon:yes stop_codon:yes gene_type:complete